VYVFDILLTIEYPGGSLAVRLLSQASAFLAANAGHNNQEDVMSEMHAVIGYLPDATAKAASQGNVKGTLAVRVDPGTDDTQVKIEASDVLGVLLGASRNGETSVQVLVKPTAKVDTITTGATADLVLQPIRDANLFRFRSPVNKIFIDPQLVKKLTALKDA
jgi:hypothetical protein